MLNKNKLNSIDVSGRIVKSESEKPICDSDNTKTTQRFKRIDGSFKLKREDLIIDEMSDEEKEIFKLINNPIIKD